MSDKLLTTQYSFRPMLHTLMYILIVLVIFIVLYYSYYGTDLSYLVTKTTNPSIAIPQQTNLQSIQTRAPVPTPTQKQKIQKQIAELTEVKEQFSNLTSALTESETNDVIQNLGTTDADLSTIRRIVYDYANNIQINKYQNDADKQKTLDLLTSIYVIKLNDEINKLNAITYGEYERSKQYALQFKP
jgi:hypothetical protein